MISLEKWYILTPLQKLPRYVRDLHKLIVANGFKNYPKSNKLPNLVTLLAISTCYRSNPHSNFRKSIHKLI